MSEKTTITADIPLFIRMLEFAREDAKTDEALHIFTENAMAINKDVLTMEDYNSLLKGTGSPMVKENINEEWYVQHADGKRTTHINQHDAVIAAKKSPGSKVGATHGAGGRQASKVLTKYQGLDMKRPWLDEGYHKTGLKSDGVLGRFKHKDSNASFEYSKHDNPWALSHNLPHQVHMTNNETRFGKIKGTVAHIAVDENPDGSPKMEKWNIKAHKAYTNEETVSELSKTALGRYITGAAADRAERNYRLGKGVAKPDDAKKGLKRFKGIDRAVKKIVKEDNLEELSNTTLRSYLDKGDDSYRKNQKSAISRPWGSEKRKAHFAVAKKRQDGRKVALRAMVRNNSKDS